MELTAQQKEKLDLLMEMDVDRHSEWLREANDAQKLRAEQRAWRAADYKLRLATLALVALELLILAGIGWRIST